MNNYSPIGIFDSGVGGLTVARTILDFLPREEIHYVGDTAHTPYGDKPQSVVRDYSLQIMDSLVDEGVKMLVIACNTASCAVLDDARERYQEGRGIPVVEVIVPAVQQAAARTRNGKVGIIGTQGTIQSGLYQQKLSELGLVVSAAACPDFVPLAEAGQTTGPELLAKCAEYLAPLKQAGVDTLILGCTHYPLLAGPISYVMGPEVNLVSSSHACARQVYSELTNRNLIRPDDVPLYHKFACTRRSANFDRLARRIMGGDFNGIVDQDTPHSPETTPIPIVEKVDMQ